MDIVLATERPPYVKLCEGQDLTGTRLIVSGEVISEDTTYMRGHGTYMEDGRLLASTAGVLTRVNRLLTVMPLRQVYQGAVGDTVVGRITEVQSNRWKVDVNARLDAELRLSNIQLPGGEQRRKDVSDERGMRALLKEGDVLCVEVQKVADSGLLILTARTNKFGKLGQGTLVTVSPSLLVQDKQRIQDICDSRVVFGANGYIYIAPRPAQENTHFSYAEDTEEVPFDIRQKIGRIVNVIRLLGKHSIMISPLSVTTAFDLSIRANYDVKLLLRPDVRLDLALSTVKQINS